MDIVKGEIPSLHSMEPATPISKPFLPMKSQILPFTPIWPYYQPYNFYPTLNPKEVFPGTR